MLGDIARARFPEVAADPVGQLLMLRVGRDIIDIGPEEFGRALGEEGAVGIEISQGVPDILVEDICQTHRSGGGKGSEQTVSIRVDRGKNNLRGLCADTQCRILDGSYAVKDIFIQDNQVKGLLLEGARTLAADRIILATGGVSYGFTGSTGDGILLAKRLGHRIVSLRAGLVPLETRQDFPRLLKGLTLKNIRLTFSDTQQRIVSPVGELLFTHFGISGPLVLTLSGRVVDWLKENKTVIVEIDLKPALSAAVLNERLLREFKVNSRKNIRTVLKNLLPASLADLFVDITGIPQDKKANQVNQEERKKIICLLKCFRMTIIRARPVEEAMITRGGVSLKDINPRTMESRIVKGLYFAGEMIDVDADTGGFNLQAAFSTGYLAGETSSLN